MRDRDVVPSDVQVRVRVRPVECGVPRSVVQAEMAYTVGVDDVVAIPLDPRFTSKRTYLGGGKFLVRNIHREHQAIHVLHECGVKWYSKLPDVVAMVERAQATEGPKLRRYTVKGKDLREETEPRVFDRVVKPGRVNMHPEGWGEVTGAEVLELWIDHVPQWQRDGWHVETAPFDPWHKGAVQAAIHVRVEGDEMLVEGDLTVDGVMLSPHELKAALDRGRTWVGHRGRAVKMPARSDLAFLAAAAQKQVPVKMGDSGRIAPLIQGVLDAKVVPGCMPIVRSLIAATKELQPSPHLKATMRPYQVEGFRWLTNHYDAGMGCLLADSMGLGKAQPVNTPVATPEGWKPIGSLRVGDEVIGKNGRPTRVVGVFPQGKKPVFRVSLCDGGSTRCCGEHLWSVTDATDLRIVEDTTKAQTIVATTRELMAEGVKFTNGNLRWYIPIVDPVEYPHNPGLVDPYAYGLALKETDRPSVCSLGAVDQRHRVMQGFLDSRGWVSENGCSAVFDAITADHVSWVGELVQSLGGVTFPRQATNRIEVVVTFPPQLSYFTQAAKSSYAHIASHGRRQEHWRSWRAILAIEPDGEEECVCIAVDAPDHLYVTEHYIVTHNTLQVLSMLATVKDAQQGKVRSLVICPTSLIENWKKEVVRFTPHFNVLLWTGNNRKANEGKLGSYDLVVTSYETFVRDATMFQQIPWDICALDEAQKVKNSDGKTWAEVCALRPRRRLAITGTPIENNLKELYAIMEFAVPGLLGTEEDFEQAFIEPIKNEDREALTRLREVVGPFILRRTKEQVATDLPDKDIIDYMCPMTVAQQSAYDVMFDEFRQQLRTALATDRSRFFALLLTATTRLRQMATEPRLLPQGAQFRAEHSGKMAAFRHLVSRRLQEGSKVLVFSQWTEMLGILRQEAERLQWTYCYLDGSTKDRHAEVDRFQNDAGVKLFFISLKAGGAGLNLTAADTVIIYDPWWNPATEAQAMDRAHRIGQKSNVTVYRLLAADSIEASIAQMQGNKAFLASSVLDADMPDEQIVQNRSLEVQRLFGLLDG